MCNLHQEKIQKLALEKNIEFPIPNSTLQETEITKF